MYVSPAVRSIRDDPIEGESVTLLLEVADGAEEDRVAAAVEDAGASVRARRQFETLEVVVAHERVAAVCAVEGVGVVETDNAVAIDPDGAGEDVEFEPDG